MKTREQFIKQFSKVLAHYSIPSNAELKQCVVGTNDIKETQFRKQARGCIFPIIAMVITIIVTKTDRDSGNLHYEHFSM